MLEELSTTSTSSRSLLDEKKRLEARVNAVEDELEEETNNVEMLTEKLRRAQSQVRTGKC